ncbi:MAG TPA: hypothetical protein VFQ61_32480 [Polyangiaceae bacterium]|nr:hypothetical protein [Polyangiaceae bacterium]
MNRRRGSRAACGLALLLGGARTAHATEPCVGELGARASAPASIGVGPAGLGTVPEACPGRDVRLRAGGSVLVARADFYGLLQTTLEMGLRYAFGRNDWFSLSVPGLQYRFAANATIEASSTSLSAGAFGYHHSFRLGPGLRFSPWLRVLIPTETNYRHARRYAVEQGFSVLGALSPRVSWMFGLAFPVYVTLIGGADHYVMTQAYVSELAYQPWPVFSAAAGAGLRIRSGERRGFEAFDPRLCLRLHVSSVWHAELAAAAPLWGTDRTDLLASFGLYAAFDRDP